MHSIVISYICVPCLRIIYFSVKFNFMVNIIIVSIKSIICIKVYRDTMLRIIKKTSKLSVKKLLIVKRRVYEKCS